jgi:methyl-accepting chemotaxis protein
VSITCQSLADCNEIMTPNISAYLVPSFIQRRYTAKFVVSILFVLLAIGIVGYVGYAQVNTTIEDDTEENLRTSAALQADSLELWTTQVYTEASLIAQQERVSQGNTQEVDAALEEFRAGDYAALHVLDYESQTLYATSLSSVFGNASNPGDSLSDVDQPWADSEVQSTLAEEGIWVSEGSYQSVMVSAPVLAFVVPTNNESRALVYTAEIGAQTDRLAQGQSSQETIIVSTDGNYVLQPTGNAETATISEEQQQVASTAVTENSPQFTSSGDSLRAYAPISRSGPVQNWVAVTSIPKDDAYAVRDTVGRNVLLIVAVAFLSLGIMGFVLGRQTVTPLRRLRTKAQAMEEGDLSVDLETSRKDEIGQLYSAFDSMRDSLHEQIEEAQSAREEAEAERERIQRINEELEATADAYSDVMQRAAEGDLTARMEAATENEAMEAISEEFNEMLAEIEQTIEELNAFAAEVATASEQVTASSEEVRSASEQISDSVQEISAGAERQNDSLQSVNQEMSDLSTTTEEIAASSNEVADIAERTAETGKEGRDAAQAAIESMREVQDESSQAVEEISQLEQEVGQIDELIERIQEISDQTNMLALNANIEASRSTSGEGDGGFGVVAQEVKELSQDAKGAAEEIENRLESIREQTRRSAEEVEQTSADVDEASEQVAAAVDALEEIAQYAGETNTGVQEISAATEEQAASTQEVVAMVDEAATISEETTAESESVAAAAEEQTTALTEVSNSASDLSEQAARLSEALDRFDTDAELEGAETRMLEGEQIEGDVPEGDELDGGTAAPSAADVEEDIDDFQPDVEADEFGADAATEPEGGADEPTAAPAAEPADAGEGASDDEPADATGDDVFEFGTADGSDAVEDLGDEPADDEPEPVDAGGAGADAAAGAEDRSLTDVSGIGEAKAESLRAAGYESLADLRAATQAELAQVEGIGDALAVEIKEDVGHE